MLAAATCFSRVGTYRVSGSRKVASANSGSKGTERRRSAAVRVVTATVSSARLKATLTISRAPLGAVNAGRVVTWPNNIAQRASLAAAVIFFTTKPVAQVVLRSR